MLESETETREESLDREQDRLSHGGHYFYYRSVLQRSVLIECYLKREVSIHLHIGIEPISEKNASSE